MSKDNIEERQAKLQALNLFLSRTLDEIEVGTFKGLAEIHRHIFAGVYENPGEIRTVDVYKGKMRFASVLYLGTALKFVDIMPADTLEDIIKKYVEMNIAHPFREGNGIAMRIWLDGMLKAKFGMVVDYSFIPRDTYIAAMEDSTVDPSKLLNLIKRAMTKDFSLNSYMRSLDAGFAYEGYSKYKSSDLI